MVARFDPENPVFAPSERPFSAAAEISDSADAEWFDEQEAAADEPLPEPAGRGNPAAWLDPEGLRAAREGLRRGLGLLLDPDPQEVLS